MNYNMPTGEECPFTIACMYCRPWFVVTNPLLYITSGGVKGYECTLPKDQYVKPDETKEEYSKRMKKLIKESKYDGYYDIHL